MKETTISKLNNTLNKEYYCCEGTSGILRIIRKSTKTLTLPSTYKKLSEYAFE